MSYLPLSSSDSFCPRQTSVVSSLCPSTKFGTVLPSSISTSGPSPAQTSVASSLNPSCTSSASLLPSSNFISGHSLVESSAALSFNSSCTSSSVFPSSIPTSGPSLLQPSVASSLIPVCTSASVLPSSSSPSAPSLVRSSFATSRNPSCTSAPGLSSFQTCVPSLSPSSVSSLTPLGMLRDDHGPVAMGFLQSNRRSLHGRNIPPRYDCVLVNWVKSESIPAPFPIGDLDENSLLNVNQYFALPTSRLFKVVVKR